MKLLLIHHRMPYPLHSGMDKARFNLIKTLNPEHDVTLLFPFDSSQRLVIPEELIGICKTIIPVPVIPKHESIKKEKAEYFLRLVNLILFRIPTYISNDYQPELAKRVEELTTRNKYDAVQALSDVTGKYIENVSGNTFTICGPMDDTLTSSWTDLLVETRFRKKIGWLLEYRARRYWQPKICDKTNVSLFFSRKDKENVQKYCKKSTRILVIPASIEADNSWNPESVNKVEKNSIIFVGGLGSLFNQHAVHFFVKKILPLIEKRCPDYKLYIVGQSPDKSILNLRNEQIIVTGKIDDIVPYIEKAAVYVSPLYAGSGVKTKIIEALRFGKAIVSTNSGIQGIWELGNDVIYVDDDPEKFANHVIYLLKNDEIRKQKSFKARQLFEKEYAFEKVKPEILKVYQQIKNDYIEN